MKLASKREGRNDFEILRKPFSGKVTTSDYNGIKFPALVTGLWLSRKKMSDCRVRPWPAIRPKQLRRK